MQSAIAEVGAIYVSARVHSGWSAVQTSQSLPTIAWPPPNRKDTGGHAFALVGYDESGFIVQNSWGSTWGYLGFARLTYSDWLENGNDAWVAVTGTHHGYRRMTLTLPTIDRARCILWLVCGADKAAMLARLVEGDERMPAGRVPRNHALVVADAAAAHSLGQR